MALTYSNYAGNNQINDAVQIARIGDTKLYYLKDGIDWLQDIDNSDALSEICDLVDEATDNLGVLGIGTAKLNDIDLKVFNRICPKDPVHQKIYNNVRDKVASFESKFFLPDVGKIYVIPRIIDNQRNSIYVSGPSGCGKSYFCSMYAKEYIKEYPANKIFLFSRKRFDPAFDWDSILAGKIIRVPLNRKFINDNTERPGCEDPVEYYKDSLVIFDDFEQILSLIHI